MNKKGIIFSLLLILCVFTLTLKTQEKSAAKQQEESESSLFKECSGSLISRRCHYQVGDQLFSLWNLGEAQTTLMIDRLRLTLSSRCLVIRVAESPLEYLFVSMDNGQIYQQRKSCEEASSLQGPSKN